MRRSGGTALVHNERELLQILIEQDQPTHGYVLIDQFNSSRPVGVANTTIYRCLARLEERGLAESQWEMKTVGAPRRLYSATPKGVDYRLDIQLPPNELLLLTRIRDEDQPIHDKDLVKALNSTLSKPVATTAAFRSLERLEKYGLVTSTWTEDSNGTRQRLYAEPPTPRPRTE